VTLILKLTLHATRLKMLTAIAIAYLVILVPIVQHLLVMVSHRLLHPFVVAMVPVQSTINVHAKQVTMEATAKCQFVMALWLMQPVKSVTAKVLAPAIILAHV